MVIVELSMKNVGLHTKFQVDMWCGFLIFTELTDKRKRLSIYMSTAYMASIVMLKDAGLLAI